MALIPWRQKREIETTSARGESPLHSLRSEIETLFDRFVHDPWGLHGWPATFERLAGVPRMDLAESEDQFTVSVELPGIDPKNVDINVCDSVLTVRGEKQAEREDKQRNYHFVERQFGSFQRSVQLPASVDPEKVDAAYKNGVLTITIGKRADARPRRIAVRSD